jgi:hypothetical protein
MAWINSRLEPHPVFSSSFRSEDGSFTIQAEPSNQISLRDSKPEEFGTLMYTAVRELTGTVPELKKDQTVDHIRAGRWSFLFRPDGSFSTNSI